MDTYKTIKSPSEGIFKDRGSKFIGYAFPVKSEEDVKITLAELRKQHHGARHHCYAYRLGPEAKLWRANDDGEPNNSAGKPILGQLQSKEVTNTLIVVVRYFGGTLLGVGGLINAYRSAAEEALNNSEIIEEHVTFTFEIEFPFDKMNDVMKMMKLLKCKILQQEFESVNKVRFEITKTELPKMESFAEKSAISMTAV